MPLATFALSVTNAATVAAAIAAATGKLTRKAAWVTGLTERRSSLTILFCETTGRSRLEGRDAKPETSNATVDPRIVLFVAANVA